MSDPQPIDLSAGLTSQPSNIDLSAGLQNSSSSGQPPTAWDAAKNLQVPGVPITLGEGLDAATGFAKGAGQTVVGTAELAKKMLPPSVSSALGADKWATPEMQSAMTPHGGAELVGYGGENLAEFMLGDEALKGMSLADKFLNVSKVAKIFQESPRLMKALQTGVDISKAQATLGPEEVAAIKKSPIIARLVSAGMDAIRQGVVQGAETTAKTGDVGEGAKAGATMAGVSAGVGLPTAGASGLLSKITEAVRPITEEIAGVNVPESALQAEKPALAAKAVGQAASKEGAEKFTSEQTQPQAVKATMSNLDKTATDTINNLKETRGELPIEHDPTNIQSVGDISEGMQKEAQTTYKKFDAVSDKLNDQYEKDVKEWQTAVKQQPELAKLPAPEKPESFSDMQAEVQKARKIINSSAPNDAKEQAFDKLDEYHNKMEEFAEKHGDEAGVSDDERKAANQAYKTSIRYDWMQNKLQTALTNKAGTTGDAIQNVVKINPSTLKSMPGQFDKKFGEGEFRKMIGPEGWSNYNKVVKALSNPINKNDLAELLLRHGGFGAATAKGPSALANKILFDPEFGSSVLKASQAMKGATKTLSPAIKNVAAQSLMGKPSIANVYSGAGSALGGSQ